MLQSSQNRNDFIPAIEIQLEFLHWCAVKSFLLGLFAWKGGLFAFEHSSKIAWCFELACEFSEKIGRKHWFFEERFTLFGR